MFNEKCALLCACVSYCNSALVGILAQHICVFDPGSEKAACVCSVSHYQLLFCTQQETCCYVHFELTIIAYKCLSKITLRTLFYK